MDSREHAAGMWKTTTLDERKEAKATAGLVPRTQVSPCGYHLCLMALGTITGDATQGGRTRCLILRDAPRGSGEEAEVFN